MGHGTSDDAAVYRLSPELALIQTVDFFTPVVDDPFMYGQIAAANALSDVYAMGGRPLLALNVVCFPSCLSPSILKEILRGGAEMVRQAGAVLAGGHSIDDNEPKYGLVVTGVVAPDKVWSNASVQPGDILVLTKPLGTGVFLAAFKGDLAPEAEFAAVVRSMATLNDRAARAAQVVGISAATDITGFGLLGHAHELAVASGVDIAFSLSSIPVFAGARDLARQGLVPGGTYRNRAYLEGKIESRAPVPEDLADILFDPQTSGGLLLAVQAPKAELLLKTLIHEGVTATAVGIAEPMQGKKPIIRLLDGLSLPA